MGINEAAVFRDEHSLILIGMKEDVAIRRSVTMRQIERMNRVAPRSRKPARHPARQLGINQEIHGSVG
jgi:hypothetical protein